jgi:hypothetical protein
MLLWIGKISVLSLLLIFLIHYLYSFFLQNLTTPKIKDLVNRPNEQYENIMKSLSGEKPVKKDIPVPIVNVQGSKMKDELKNFLAKEMNNKQQAPVFEQGGTNLSFSSYS